jgi:uncharacterized protein YacL
MEIQQRLIKVKDLILYAIGFIIGIFIVGMITKTYEIAFKESILVIVFTVLLIAFISRNVWVNK